MDLHHVLIGAPRKPVVLLLHGFLGTHRDWLPLMRALEPQFRCLAVDLPGHGKSVNGVDEDYSVPSAATAIINLLDTLDVPSFSIVGYSMGGRLALYLSSVYAMRTDALVIESASPGLKTDEERNVRHGLDEQWARMLLAEDFDAFLNAWYAQPLFDSLTEHLETFARVREARKSNNPRELARALRGMGVSTHPSLWKEWRENHIPALLVAGERDVKYRDLASEMHAICPSSRVAVIEGAGHNVHEERPDAYNSAVVSFLIETLNINPQTR